MILHLSLIYNIQATESEEIDGTEIIEEIEKVDDEDDKTEIEDVEEEVEEEEVEEEEIIENIEEEEIEEVEEEVEEEEIIEEEEIEESLPPEETMDEDAIDYAAIIDLYGNLTGDLSGIETETENNSISLYFNSNAKGKTYKIVHSPTSLNSTTYTTYYNNIFIQNGVTGITLVTTGIKCDTRITLFNNSEVTIKLDGINNFNNGISVPSTAKLTIESFNGNDSSDQMVVRLNSTDYSATYAGIGGSKGADSGTINIKGGTVDVNINSAGAGIGGGGGGFIGGPSQGGSSDNITISGGIIKVIQYYDATKPNPNRGACIGGGGGSASGGSGGNITITGGNIIAEQYSENGAGIGGGAFGKAGKIIITGGTVNASSNNHDGGGAGIGNGFGINININSNIKITAGTVTARATLGAGIGAGHGNTSTIEIEGGTVIAESESGAGIGSGQVGFYGSSVTITGGTVIAKSESGAGIGNASNTEQGGRVTITGGIIIASSNTGTGIGCEEKGSAPEIRIEAEANVKAYSGGSKPAIAISANDVHNTLNNTYFNLGTAYFVKASLNEALSKTEDVTMKVYANDDEDQNTVLETLTLPANYKCFAYSTGWESREHNILAYNGSAYIGMIMREIDSSPKIYSINTLAGYNEYNGNKNDAVLPVKRIKEPSIISINHSNTTDSTVTLTVIFDMGTYVFDSGKFQIFTDGKNWEDIPGSTFNSELCIGSVDMVELYPNTKYYYRAVILYSGGSMIESSDFGTAPLITRITANKNDNESAKVSAAFFSSGNLSITGVEIYLYRVDSETPENDFPINIPNYDTDGFDDVIIEISEGKYYIYVRITNDVGLSDFKRVDYKHIKTAQIEVSIPVKLIFAAFESNGPEIVSPDYYIQNYGETEIIVTIESFTIENAESLNLTVNPVNNKDISLIMHNKSALPKFNDVNLAAIDKFPAYFGHLNERESQNGSDRMSFTLKGKYIGPYDIAKPKYFIVFKFEAVQAE